MNREKIVRALEDRAVVAITYGGDGLRMIQPHAIIRKPDGTEILEAYQVRGFSETEVEHGWKNFDVTRIGRVELLPEQFEPRRDFRPVSSESAQVVAAVRNGEALSA